MYIVANENTFGYIVGSGNGQFQRMAVLSVKVEKGGDPLLLLDTTTVRKDRTRPATDADFDSFKIVKPKNSQY